MKRILAFTYGVGCYGVFFVTCWLPSPLWGISVDLPRTLDSQADASPWTALAVDGGLLALFALQHSVMARPWFKQAWTRLVPQPVERSTYVLFSSAALLTLMWQWRPVAGLIWDVRDGVLGTVLMAGYTAGLLIVLVSTFLIDHFDLFGLRQVSLCLMGRPYVHSAFRTPFFYKYVRDPLYVGWIMTFWSAPLMTSAHLFFAAMTTAYILVAIQLEEHDLTKLHGQKYSSYRERVPMIIPSLTARAVPEEGKRIAASI